jgi:hypothetical protein
VPARRYPTPAGSKSDPVQGGVEGSRRVGRQRGVDGSESSHHAEERFMIVLGIVLLIIGFIAKVAILWTLGIIVLVIGAVLAVLGTMGRAVGGRRHYY